MNRRSFLQAFLAVSAAPIVGRLPPMPSGELVGLETIVDEFGTSAIAGIEGYVGNPWWRTEPGLFLYSKDVVELMRKQFQECKQ